MSGRKVRGRPKKIDLGANKGKDSPESLSSSSDKTLTKRDNKSKMEEESYQIDEDYIPEITSSPDDLSSYTQNSTLGSERIINDASTEDMKSSVDGKQPKKRGRPKGTKNGKGEKKIKVTKFENKNTLKSDSLKFVRVSKQLTSVKDKLVRIYGENKEKLLGLAIQKDTFETSVFNIEEKELLPSPIRYEDITHFLSLDSFSTVIISKNEFDKLLPLNDEEITFQVNEEKFNLLKNEVAELPNSEATGRKGFLLNVGGFISDMAWSNTPDTEIQYLAVSVSNSNRASDFELRLSGRPIPHPAVINVYEFNVITERFKLIYQLAHDYGLSWDMKWHPGYHPCDKQLGLLSGIFQDGTIKFLPIPKPADLEIHHLQTPAIEISVKDSPITSFDFLDSRTLSCGFQNGYYGELGLIGGQLHKYKQIFDSFAISIKVILSNYEDTLVCMGSVDGNCCIFDPKDIRLSRTFCTRTRGSNTLPLGYIPQLFTIIRTDSLSSIKAFTPRAVFVDHNICQHENSVCSLGTSTLHPMLLSGSADGSIMLNNIVRRMLQGMKNNTEIYRYVRLWKWRYDKIPGIYILDANYEIFKFSNTETSNVKIDHAGLNIQSVKWIEALKGGTWYTFSNAAGFIVVEKLGG